MTKINFTKLQALGNDFLVIGPRQDVPNEAYTDLTRRICERHTGVGADGIIVLKEEKDKPIRWGFRIFNADGSEAEISGNGLRAAMVCLRYHGWTTADREVFLTEAGERACELKSAQGRSYEVMISMSEPRFASKDIPFDDGRQYEKIIDYPITVNRKAFGITCVSIGNPHCNVFVDRLPSRLEWHQLGRELESHPFFPKRTNVEFIRVLNRNEIEVFFWERGVGETLSSGTGSCSAAVAAIVKGLTDSMVRVWTSLGGMLVEWRPGTGIRQTGPVEVVFEGVYEFD